jgi:hypothetical protein
MNQQDKTRKLADLVRTLVGVERDIGNKQSECLYKFDFYQELIYKTEVCHDEYPSVSSVISYIDMVKDLIDSSDEDYLAWCAENNDHLLYYPKVIDGDSLSINIISVMEPEPWEDWENEVYYLEIYADIKESDEDYEARKHTAERVIKDLEKQVEVLNHKIKCLVGGYDD